MLIRADARHIPLRDGCVQMVCTSPPYWGLRDYGTGRWDGGDLFCNHTKDRSSGVASSGLEGGKGTTNHQQEAAYRDVCGKCGARRVDNQIGLERTPDEYVQTMVTVFRELRRVLKADGVAWLNLGDSYAAGKCGRDDSGENGRFGGPRIAPSQRKAPDGLKPKDLVGIPWRVAFALQADGWYLRSDIIWHKPNPMPESVTDRPTKSHEYLFLLAKAQSYYYDAHAIAEASQGIERPNFDGQRGLLPKAEVPGRTRQHDRCGGKNERSGDRRKVGFNERWDAKEYAGKHAEADEQAAGRRVLGSVKAAREAGAPHDQPFGSTRNRRSVWTIPTKPYPGAHFATMPEALVEPCILAGSKPGDLIFDPFCGTGTVGRVALTHGRRFVGTDLNPKYLRDLAPARLSNIQLSLREASL